MLVCLSQDSCECVWRLIWTSLTVVFFILEPWLTPILEDVTDALQKSSAAVINTEDQYEVRSWVHLCRRGGKNLTKMNHFQVFDNPYASDPTHSLLSKVRRH